jgi:hypothetical protein
MKTFDFIQATISHNLKDPHSKALEPDCLSPFACDCNTATGRGEGGLNVRHKFSGFMYKRLKDLEKIGQRPWHDYFFERDPERL